MGMSAALGPFLFSPATDSIWPCFGNVNAPTTQDLVRASAAEIPRAQKWEGREETSCCLIFANTPQLVWDVGGAIAACALRPLTASDCAVSAESAASDRGRMMISLW